MNTLTLAIGLVGFGAAIGNAIIIAALLSGMARQPKLEGSLFTRAIVGLAFVEGIFFISVVLAIIFK